MAEFPALPLFTDAYLADTRHLTTEEHGVYLLLLMCAWRTRGCALRDEDRKLARIAGVTSNKWRKIRPAMLEFFSVEEGYWRQKKLSNVYETVSKKVERNRLNGSKGGRAKASQHQRSSKQANYMKNIEVVVPDGKFSPSWSQVAGSCDNREVATSELEASKTRIKTKDSSGSGLPLENGGVENFEADNTDTLVRVAAAAAIDPLNVEGATVRYWVSAGADLRADIVPTISRLRDREVKRSGQAPFHLAYYTAAILEARNKRVGADVAGRAYAQDLPPRAQLLKFDPENSDHWRLFLGDRASRFRGEYLSRNWRIPAGHAVFFMAELGPDPCHRFNSTIPAVIYDEYSACWSWRPQVID